MHPAVALIITLLLWLIKGFYLSPIIERLKSKFGEIAAYWTVVTAFNGILAVFITLLCPSIYFIKWTVPVRDFALFLALGLLSGLVGIKSLLEMLHPRDEKAKRELEELKKFPLLQIFIFQFITAAIPEEVFFRYILLGSLALINPFAGLISSSVFFGLSHKFSHPERKADFLLSNVLAGFVLGWAYLYTKSLLLVIVLHWSYDVLGFLLLKYSNADKLLLTLFLTYGISTPLILRTTFSDAVSYLSAIYSPKDLLLGISIGLALLGITYLSIKLRKRKKS